MFEEFRERGEHAAVVAVDLVKHDGRIRKQGKQTRRRIPVLEEGKELIHRGREDPLRPLLEREEPFFSIAAVFSIARINGCPGIVVEQTFEVESCRAMNQRGEFGARVTSVIAIAFGRRASGRIKEDRSGD
jgi:hypothetical protein